MKYKERNKRKNYLTIQNQPLSGRSEKEETKKLVFIHVFFFLPRKPKQEERINESEPNNDDGGCFIFNRIEYLSMKKQNSKEKKRNKKN